MARMEKAEADGGRRLPYDGRAFDGRQLPYDGRDGGKVLAEMDEEAAARILAQLDDKACALKLLGKLCAGDEFGPLGAWRPPVQVLAKMHSAIVAKILACGKDQLDARKILEGGGG